MLPDVHCTDIGMWAHDVGLHAEDEGDCDKLIEVVVGDFDLDADELRDAHLCDAWNTEYSECRASGQGIPPKEELETMDCDAFR